MLKPLCSSYNYNILDIFVTILVFSHPIKGMKNSLVRVRFSITKAIVFQQFFQFLELIRCMMLLNINEEFFCDSKN